MRYQQALAAEAAHGEVEQKGEAGLSYNLLMATVDADEPHQAQLECCQQCT